MTLHIDIVIFSCGGVCKFEVYYCSIRGLIASLQPCRVANKKKLHCPSPILPCRHHFRIVVTRRRAVHSWCVDQIWQPALGLLWVLRVRIILGNRCGKTRTIVGTSFVCRRVVVRVPARVPAGGPAAHTTRTSWCAWYEFALS